MPAVVNSTSSVGDITEWPSISSWSLSSMYWRKRFSTSSRVQVIGVSCGTGTGEARW